VQQFLRRDRAVWYAVAFCGVSHDQCGSTAEQFEVWGDHPKVPVNVEQPVLDEPDDGGIIEQKLSSRRGVASENSAPLDNHEGPRLALEGDGVGISASSSISTSSRFTNWSS
jgi:hypothetical protein